MTISLRGKWIRLRKSPPSRRVLEEGAGDERTGDEGAGDEGAGGPEFPEVESRQRLRRWRLNGARQQQTPVVKRRWRRRPQRSTKGEAPEVKAKKGEATEVEAESSKTNQQQT